MPEMALRAVLSFDAKNQTFNPAAHNLPISEAGSFADELHSKDGVDCRIIEQKTKHKKANAQGCNVCQKAAEAESKKQQAEQEQAAEEKAANEDQED